MLTSTKIGFNFLSHGSQDLYPTYLEKSKGFSNHAATVATIIGNCGAIAYVSLSRWSLPPYHLLTAPCRLQWWCSRRIPFSIPRSPTYHHRLHPPHRCLHSSLDHPKQLLRPRRWRVLYPIRCTGSMGCYSYPACRNEPSRVQGDIPWCGVSARKREFPSSHSASICPVTKC